MTKANDLTHSRHVRRASIPRGVRLRRIRPYSRYTREALRLQAARIKTARLARNITSQELAERAGISRDLLYRIEQGHPKCSIAVVFEVMSLLGLSLFQSEHDDLIVKSRMIEDKLALLPSRARKSKLKIDDDF